MDLKGTKTEANLKEAFAGESQANTKYTFYAKQAKKDGFVQIQDIFLETARHERSHAKLWFKALHGNTIPATTDNLQDAADGEHYETNEMYPRMAKEADEEGFKELARQFRAVGAAESYHETRYLKLKDNVDNDKVFKKEKEETWICTNCGHIHEGKDAPQKCPTCAHPIDYFELRCLNY